MVCGITHYQKGMLPGDCSFTLKLKGMHVGVVALNSVFLAVATGGRVPTQGWEISTRQLERACGGDIPAFVVRHDALILVTHASRDALCPRAVEAYDASINPDGRFLVHASAYNGRKSHSVTGKRALTTAHLALGPNQSNRPGGRGIASIELQVREGTLFAHATSWQVNAREEQRTSAHVRASLRHLAQPESHRRDSHEGSVELGEPMLRTALTTLYPSREDAIAMAERLGIGGAWRESAGAVEDLWQAILDAADHEAHAELQHAAHAAISKGTRGTGPSVPTLDSLRRLARKMLPTREILLAFTGSLPFVPGSDLPRAAYDAILDELLRELDPRDLFERLRRWNSAFVDQHASDLEFENINHMYRSKSVGRCVTSADIDKITTMMGDLERISSNLESIRSRFGLT